jgi:SAM-dependent methyltransferase
MEKRGAIARLLAQPAAYRLWQAPFAARKLAPVIATGIVSRARRVLDVGCGPGTNAPFFMHADYLGVDLNARYVDDARRRFPKAMFEVADVTSDAFADSHSFDFILMNSLLHHIDDAGACHVLDKVARMLTDAGSVHILDLVLPERPSPARVLARLDRGEHPRPLPAWRELFRRSFTEEAFEPYPLGIGPLTLWNMVYFRGRSR